jgi:hypothetical protein
VGLPPGELTGLIQDTMTTTGALADAAKAADKAGCEQDGKGQCIKLRFDVYNAMGDVKDSIAGWGPYGV